MFTKTIFWIYAEWSFMTIQLTACKGLYRILRTMLHIGLSKKATEMVTSNNFAAENVW